MSRTPSWRKYSLLTAAAVAGVAFGGVLAYVTPETVPRTSAHASVVTTPAASSSPSSAPPSPPPVNPDCPYTPFGEPADSYRDGAAGSGRTGKGVRLIVTVIRDDTCGPVDGATVDVWHEGPDGQYADEYRYRGRTGQEGRAEYVTDPARRSSEGEPHIHIRVRDTQLGSDVWLAIPMPQTRQKLPVQVVLHAPPPPLPGV